jgi:UDP-glucose-4-epimerase GalE
VNRRILVTGGAGYIGSHTCKSLFHHGFEPICYDNLVYGHRDFVKWGPFEEGDISDSQRLQSVFDKYQPEVVMHFAAYAYIGESMLDPLKYYENNVYGSMTLLNAMRESNIEKIIFSSTCATYGIPKTIPIPDSHVQQPVNPYGRSKLVIEHMLRDYAYAYGLHGCSLRYFNAAGSDPDGELGEWHEPETHLIPNIMLTATGKRESITVFGDDYGTRDGTCVRDYIHVTDLAEAHVLALNTLEEEPGLKTYNLGNDRGYSVKDIIDVSAKICGQKIPVEIGKRRLGDPPILIADSSSAKSELGWKPEYNNLEQIIETAWNWFSRQS